MSDYIRTGFDNKVPRDYLDDRPISNNTTLDLWKDALWKRGRYELTQDNTAYFTYAETTIHNDLPLATTV